MIDLLYMMPEQLWWSIVAISLLACVAEIIRTHK